MILVTGGAGYIGSHACVALLSAGEQIVVFDNFCNSSPEALDRVQRICGKPLAVVEGDIRDQDALESVMVQYGCTAVMHFAGLKSVQDSVAQPLEYYDQNVVGSQRLLRAMSKTGVKSYSAHRPPCTACRISCPVPRIIRSIPPIPMAEPSSSSRTCCATNMQASRPGE